MSDLASLHPDCHLDRHGEVVLPWEASLPAYDNTPLAWRRWAYRLGLSEAHISPQSIPAPRRRFLEWTRRKCYEAGVADRRRKFYKNVTWFEGADLCKLSSEGDPGQTRGTRGKVRGFSPGSRRRPADPAA